MMSGDEVLREQLRLSALFFRKLSWIYKSNWRVLHIDGLEGLVYNPKLPVSTGKKIQFFKYPLGAE